MWNARRKMWKLLAAGVVFLVGGLMPWARNEQANTTLLVLASAFILIGVSVGIKAAGSNDIKPPTTGR